MTLEDMNSAISSQASADGRLLLNGQDGEAPSGREAVPVSRFRAQESEKAMPTNATSGPLFNNSSPSAILGWSLESKLRQRMAGNGCPLYELTWSQWDMPAGPQICRQRASARRTSAKDFTGWPTPNGAPTAKYSDGPHDGRAGQRRAAHRATWAEHSSVQLTGWPTPNAGPLNDTDTKWQERRKAAKAHNNGNGFGMRMAVQLSGWATPTSRDHKDGAANLDNVPVNKLLGREVLLTGWPMNLERNHRAGLKQRKDSDKAGVRWKPAPMLAVDNWRDIEWLSLCRRKGAANSTRNSPVG